MGRHKPVRARRGIALMLVLVVIGLATVLGYAMLSGATLRTQISHNAANATAAESLAESGVNLALYYLQYPEYAPGGPYSATGAYWTGTGGPIAFGSNVTGTIDVTVTRDASDKWTYDIVSVGRPSNQSNLTRTTRARVSAVTRYHVTHSAVMENDLTMPSSARFYGDVFARRGVVLKSNSSVSGKVYRGVTQFQLYTPGDGWEELPFKPFAIPTSLSDIRSYRTYNYVNDGSTDTAGSIAAGTTLLSNLNPTATNRAGIYYCEGDLTISGDRTINGTLIVRGNLICNGANIKITAANGYPALIVDGNLDIRLLSPKIEINGLCWVRGRALATVTSLGIMEVRGALMVCGSSPFFSTATLFKPEVRYEPDKVDIPDLCEVGRTITALNVRSWNAPQ